MISGPSLRGAKRRSNLGRWREVRSSSPGLLLDCFASLAMTCGIIVVLFSTTIAHADAAFQTWLQSLWPQAQAMGVSRATFDTATRGLEPDLTLPDLVLPGRPEKPSGGQPEFVQTPADYVKEASIDRL